MASQVQTANRRYGLGNKSRLVLTQSLVVPQCSSNSFRLYLWIPLGKHHLKPPPNHHQTGPKNVIRSSNPLAQPQRPKIHRNPWRGILEGPSRVAICCHHVAICCNPTRLAKIPILMISYSPNTTESTESIHWNRPLVQSSCRADKNCT